jgi:CelD/BcsL family acetyltransferase involved in cellulose biosynthesis
VKLTVYDQENVFDLLQAEWNDLLHRSTCDNIFSTWEWQSSWWKAYQAGELWVVACRDDDGHLIGLAPWFIEHNQDGERVVRSIGCVDVTDYVDVLVEPEHVQPVFTMLADHLLEHSDRYDRVNLCNIPETSPTREMFSAILEGCGFSVEVVLQEVCPVIVLPPTYEDYLARLDKKQRHELRRKVRRAESEEKVAWYIVGSEHDVHAEMERFLTLMAASQRQKAEFLEDPKNVDFFKRVMPIAFDRGWVQLSFLTINGKAVATYLNFDYNGRILVYNSGLLPDAYPHLSPGIVLLCYNIEHAIETHHHVFDFLRGNENYKYRMGAEDTHVYKLKAQLA